ncbi:MAG: ribonuclease HII [Anaerolineaceae bacterium]|nr:ribonuclease HII [Anaerolineaceae bacterium]
MQNQKFPDLQLECQIWESGSVHIAGLDEAGRGAWAGPVSAGAVILPVNKDILVTLAGVRDSKRMTPRQRNFWVEKIKTCCLSWGVGFASHQEIDQNGIVPATHLAMLRALAQLSISPQHLLIDALRLPEIELPQTAIKKGDAKSLSIAAASVLAKTSRDTLMIQYGEEMPVYAFECHKGYGTRKHQKALTKCGPCDIHRKSFAPIAKLLRSE